MVCVIDVHENTGIRIRKPCLFWIGVLDHEPFKCSKEKDDSYPSSEG